MAKRAPSKKQSPPAPVINVGDFVLCGGTQASYPDGWYLGEVLWAGPSDLLIQRSTINGKTWRETVSTLSVRAVGTIADLVHVQNQASDGVRPLLAAVHDAESALGAARDALFAKLEELAKGGVQVIPSDFDAQSDAFSIPASIVSTRPASAFLACWPISRTPCLKPGADLALVWPRFALWLLTEELPQYTEGFEKCAAALADIAALYRELVETGMSPVKARWSAAADAATAARWSAAADARWSAADARWSAYKRQADKLVELLGSTPIVSSSVAA